MTFSEAFNHDILQVFDFSSCNNFRLIWYNLDIFLLNSNNYVKDYLITEKEFY